MSPFDRAHVTAISLENRTKIAIFPTPCVFNAPLKGFPLELGIGAMGQKNCNDEATSGRKSFKIGLAVLIQYRPVTDTQPVLFKLTATVTGKVNN